MLLLSIIPFKSISINQTAINLENSNQPWTGNYYNNYYNNYNVRILFILLVFR